MYKNILTDAYNYFGWKLPFLAFFMFITSLFEGIGLTLLVPLLSQFGMSDAEYNTQGTLSSLINTFLEWANIPTSLGGIMAFMVVIFLIQVSMTLLVKILQTRYTNQYTANWRKKLFSTVISANWKYLQKTDLEVQANQILSETSRNSAALGLILQISNSFFFIITYGVIAWLSSWEIVSGLIVVGGLIYLLTRPISNRGREVGLEVTAVSEQLYSKTQEFLLNAKLIKSTATEKIASDIINKDINAFEKVYIEAGLLPAFIQAIYMWLGYTLLGLSIWLAIENLNVAPAVIIVTIYIFLRLYTQLSNLQQLRQSFLLSAPALENCQRELDAATDSKEHQGNIDENFFNNANVGIKFDSLSVKYSDKIALKEVNITIDPGSTIGLTGPSGAGKSTFVDAIIGLILPSSGMIFLNEHPITSVSPHVWRRHIGYVAQETLIIKGSIIENIAWGNIDATEEEIKAAAKQANADEFITAMPHGYNTIIGGRSMKMSGGQRQRIGLARALLGAKKLLILDEATSALDSESEKKVIDAVTDLQGKVTVIMVAHRLSTLQSTDQILVFENGEITQQGEFKTLKSSNGTFNKLWNMQSVQNE